MPRYIRITLVLISVFLIYYLQLLRLPQSQSASVYQHVGRFWELSSHDLDEYTPPVVPQSQEVIKDSVLELEGKFKPSTISPPDPQVSNTGGKGKFADMQWSFMKDLTYEQPFVDMSKYAKIPPHNSGNSPDRMAFATYFGSRNSSLHDPYFIATQLLVHRILWNPKTASKKHPMIVFVAPFISQEQRNPFLAAGAIVRELPLVNWNPMVEVHARWRDLFSKLHMWDQTDFSRIAFLDADTFPIGNIDEIFLLAVQQNCVPHLLSRSDGKQSEICDYVFASAPEPLSPPTFNVGVTVFSPNKAMHARLLRNFVKTDRYDESMAEQAFLNWQFGSGSAFPVRMLERTWNGCLPLQTEEGKLKIVHQKLWVKGLEGLPTWLDGVFAEGWREMVEDYEGATWGSKRIGGGKKMPN